MAAARQEVELQNPSTASDRFFERMVDGASFDAPARLKWSGYHRTDREFTYNERADYRGVHSGLMHFGALLCEAARKQGIPLYVHCALRTKQEQDTAFSGGFSSLQWPDAPHCRGGALDIVHARYHWDLTKQEWSLLGKIGKNCHELLMRKTPLRDRWGLVWGGDWRKPYDPAHWQVAEWRNLPVIPPEGGPVRMSPRGILATVQ